MEPIRVLSAFGGLGLYRLPAAFESRYVGFTEVGTEVCEHVAFNLALARRGELYILPSILPSLQNAAPPEHLGAEQAVSARRRPLEQDGQSTSLLAPTDHRLDQYRQLFPLYDRRLPLLSRLVAEAAPDGVMIDVGANIGDTIALCRLAGCRATFVALEPSQRSMAFFEANMTEQSELFGSVRALPVAVSSSASEASLALVEHDGTAQLRIAEAAADAPRICFERLDDMVTGPVSLLKLDTDGHDGGILASHLDYLRARKPVIWTETEVLSEAGVDHWGEVLAELTPSHPEICVFDNFGFLIAHGATRERRGLVLDLLRYALRYRQRGASEAGEPRIHYLHPVLFPPGSEPTRECFLQRLPEWTPAGSQDRGGESA